MFEKRWFAKRWFAKISVFFSVIAVLQTGVLVFFSILILELGRGTKVGICHGQERGRKEERSKQTSNLKGIEYVYHIHKIILIIDITKLSCLK